MTLKTPGTDPVLDAATTQSTLTGWVREQGRARNAAKTQPTAGLRFAFYGRVSTEDHQDPATSRAWQLLQAQAVTSGYGRVVTEFFDVGRSRFLPWARRPEAAALLTAVADPGRNFDAIVIGSCERAFYGNQFAAMAPLFQHYGVALWVPELGGAIDPALVGHEELMILLGILSKREIARAQIRVRSAITVQARDQGRYLGGRPPYGYRIVGAGPHPNQALARRGVRLHRLDIDPECGRIVKWIYAQRLALHSVARITRALNDASIPCPSATDPERNPHRSGRKWSLTSVRAILANPRYTGHEVWNRQRTDHELLDPDNTSLGHRDVTRWNDPEDWIISTKPAHPALVSEADFIAVQRIRAPRQPTQGRTYQLAGLLRCGLCSRRMDSCWAGRAAYRCRHGHSSSTPPDPIRPPNAYVREDHILPHLPALLIRFTATEPDDIILELSHAEPPTKADAVEHLRTKGITLTFDPTTRTLTTDTPRGERITIGRP
ncbi:MULTISPECIES: recombinase family protein [unclassified Streptomyces]|uniref:recombinase family protein n=1 Tax=unclassified Streptomyces TaxID=2593676 RepID=UPI0003AB06E2|nr:MULTISPECIES: recombinase family protein [unclassified Streptomyces]MYT32055.1 recombinase family protein [Streptomyces sp. SID8354]